MVDKKIQEIINNAFYQNWRKETFSGSRMDLETFKREAFYWMQGLEDIKGVDINWDKIEKFIEEEHSTGYCTSWGEAFSCKNYYEEYSA